MRPAEAARSEDRLWIDMMRSAAEMRAGGKEVDGEERERVRAEQERLEEVVCGWKGFDRSSRTG